MSSPVTPLYSELAGDPDLQELVQMFVDEMPSRMVDLRTAAAEGATDVVKGLSHQLKGAAGGYGFFAITDAARIVEELAQAQAAAEPLIAAVDALTLLMNRATADSPPARAA